MGNDCYITAENLENIYGMTTTKFKIQKIHHVSHFTNKNTFLIFLFEKFVYNLNGVYRKQKIFTFIYAYTFMYLFI